MISLDQARTYPDLLEQKRSDDPLEPVGVCRRGREGEEVDADAEINLGVLRIRHSRRRRSDQRELCDSGVRSRSRDGGLLDHPPSLDWHPRQISDH